MNHFGHIADDLTSLEESIDGMLDYPHAKTLKAALQRAFVEACKASRAKRLADEAVGKATVSPVRVDKALRLMRGGTSPKSAESRPQI